MCLTALTAFELVETADILKNQIKYVRNYLKDHIKKVKDYLKDQIKELKDDVKDVKCLTLCQTEMKLHDMSVVKKLLKDCGKNK